MNPSLVDAETDFNTSNVEVPRNKIFSFFYIFLNFNTSNVEVPLLLISLDPSADIYFNTSNVEVPRSRRWWWWSI